MIKAGLIVLAITAGAVVTLTYIERAPTPSKLQSQVQATKNQQLIVAVPLRTSKTTQDSIKAEKPMPALETLFIGEDTDLDSELSQSLDAPVLIGSDINIDAEPQVETEEPIYIGDDLDIEEYLLRDGS